MKSNWLPALLVIGHFGEAAVVFRRAKQHVQVHDDPSTLHRLCIAKVEELDEDLAECEAALARENAHTDRSISESSTERHAANAEVERLQETLRLKENELDNIEAENDKLHKKLLSSLDKLSPNSFTLVGVPPEADQAEVATKEAVTAESAWMHCENRKRKLQFKVEQCQCRLAAEQSRQEIRRGVHEQLKSNAERNVQIMKQQIEILEAQIAQAHARHQRLLEQIRQLKDISLAQQSGHLTLESTPAHGDGEEVDLESIEIAKKALQAAESARAEALAQHQAALAKSQQQAAEVARSSKALEDANADLKELSHRTSTQWDKLQQERQEAQEAKVHAAERREEAAARGEEHTALAKESREAFKKAFLIDHERSQAKQTYEDAVVQAKIASKRWEKEQHDAAVANNNFTQLADERQLLKWHFDKAQSVQVEAAAKSLAAENHAEYAKAQLEAEENRVRDAKHKLEEAMLGHGSAAAPRVAWKSAMLSLALAAILT